MDWSDEVRARLKQLARWVGISEQDRSDIRAALGEIDKQSHLHDLDHKLANAMMERADAAEADRDEWRETARSEMAGRRAAEAEVERLRAALTGIINVQDDQTIWPAYSNEKGKRMDAAIDHARAALRGGGK